MKARFALLLTMALIASISVSAQPGSRHDRSAKAAIRCDKQAHRLAHELSLDESTTAKFVATYCEYNKEIKALRPQRPQRTGELSEAEAEQAIKARFEYEQRVLDIRKSYYAKYREFLSAQQVARMYDLDKPMMGRMHKAGRHDKGKFDGKRKMHKGKPVSACQRHNADSRRRSGAARDAQQEPQNIEP